MIETLRPWAGLAVGLLVAIRGATWALKPQAYVGVGLIPATDPRTVRAFGIFFFVLGLLNMGLNLSSIV